MRGRSVCANALRNRYLKRKPRSTSGESAQTRIGLTVSVAAMETINESVVLSEAAGTKATG